MITQIPSTIPSDSDLKDTIGEIEYLDNKVHNDITWLFTRGNLLYNLTSTTEDIITGKYLALLGQAKSIVNANYDKKSYVVESFNSQQFLDTKFPIDNRLTIDTQNGLLTLPVLSTEDLQVGAVIVETDSNGEPGNSLMGGTNADINAINSTAAVSMFEYEKITNIFTSTELYLSLTLKLEKESICNGIQLKLFADKGTQYPVIDAVETSREGSRWIPVDFLEDPNSDFFLKFDPRRVRYLKIRLKQASYKYVQTPFGAKYRYSIGIRQITAKKIKYASKGEYVSIPFAGRGEINKIVANWNDKAIGDVKYFLSANNGGRWTLLQKDVAKELINSELGLRGDLAIDFVRMKIEMARTSSPSAVSTIEYMLANSDNRYFLKNLPLEVIPTLGRHISRGDMQPYDIPIQSVASIDPALMSGGAQCMLDSRYKITLLYVPYYEADPDIPGSKSLFEDIVVKINGVTLKNDGTVYIVSQHPNPAHSVLHLDINAIPDDELKNALLLTPSTMMNGTISVSLKPYVHDHRYYDTPIVNLPQPSFIKTKDGFTVQQASFIPVKFSESKIYATSVSPNSPYHGIDDDVLTWWETNEKTTVNEDGQQLAPADQYWDYQFWSDTPIALESYVITPFLGNTDIGNGTLDFNPTQWELQVRGDAVTDKWITVDSQNIDRLSWSPNQSKEFNVGMTCKYTKFRLKIFTNSQEVTQQFPASFQTRMGFTNIGVYTKEVKALKNSVDFDVVDSSTLKIAQAAYDTRADYLIMYFPAVDVTDFLTLPLLTNEVAMQGLHTTPPNTKLCFEYKYQDQSSLEDINYYTPVVKDYRIELA